MQIAPCYTREGHKYQRLHYELKLFMWMQLAPCYTRAGHKYPKRLHYELKLFMWMQIAPCYTREGHKYQRLHYGQLIIQWALFRQIFIMFRINKTLFLHHNINYVHYIVITYCTCFTTYCIPRQVKGQMYHMGGITCLKLSHRNAHWYKKWGNINNITWNLNSLWWRLRRGMLGFHQHKYIIIKF